MIWTKITSRKFDISARLNLSTEQLKSEELQLVDHNEMLYIFKKEIALPELEGYFIQYYFGESPEASKQKLTKKNLLEAYRDSGCYLGLVAFLNSENIVALNQHGHFRLFDVINSHIEKKAYQLLKYETFLSKSSKR